MSLSIASLPSDFESLQAFTIALLADNQTLETRLQTEIASHDSALKAHNAELHARDAEIYAQSLHIEKLKMQLALLRRDRFGQSSEKMEHAIEQLELQIGDLEEAQAEREERVEAANPTAKQAKSHPVRQPLPDHLPRERVEHNVCACRSCGGTDLSLVGTDEREMLERVPAYYKVVVHVRPKMSCRACQTITQAPMPSIPRSSVVVPAPHCWRTSW